MFVYRTKRSMAKKKITAIRLSTTTKKDQKIISSVLTSPGKRTKTVRIKNTELIRITQIVNLGIKRLISVCIWIDAIIGTNIIIKSVP